MASVKRKIALIILGNDKRGKGHIIRSIFNESGRTHKGVRTLACGDETFQGYVFVRSYQESEKSYYCNDIESCFSDSNSNWASDDFFIIPSHIGGTSSIDIDNITYVLNSRGFNVICCYIVLNIAEIALFQDILSRDYWYEKIEIFNEENATEWQNQTMELGERLRQLICSALQV